MASTALRIRTSLLIGAATGTMIAAALMPPRRTTANQSVVSDPISDTADDGMMVKARFVTSRILPSEQTQNLAITITAPSSTTETARPPVSLAIVIDRSGSMHGAPIENAKAAALTALRQLAPSDAFSVITYSSSSEIVLPIQAASDANKAAARAAIESIYDDGGTCISCGLENGAAELGHTPVRGLRRILLISDGQANEGLYDRNELAQLAANKAARGVSISTVGVGLDFDEATMRRLAEVGRGNYYFVEDTVALSTMFNHELGSLSQTVATDIRLVVTPKYPRVEIRDVYGYPMVKQGDSVIIPIADLRAGETRKVVLGVKVDVPFDPGVLNPYVVTPIANLDVGWHRVPDDLQRAAHTTVIADFSAATDAELAASADPEVAAIIEQALSARALEQAATAYEKDGLDGARRVLEQRSQEVHAKARVLGEAKVLELDAATSETLEGFARAPEQAKKATSVRAYRLAR